MNKTLFYHNFRNGMGPFMTRTTGGQDLPSSPDAATARDGWLELRLLDNPLRTGHVWAPDFAFVEGFVEFTMKYPAPPGIHSSGWLQSITPYDDEDDHEVDVSEHFGNAKVVQHSIWNGPFPPRQPYRGAARLDVTQWNKYGADCRQNGYIFTINGVEVGRAKRSETGLRAVRPKNLIISLLSDGWERPKINFNNLQNYYALCQKVRVTEEMGW